MAKETWQFLLWNMAFVAILFMGIEKALFYLKNTSHDSASQKKTAPKKGIDIKKK